MNSPTFEDGHSVLHPQQWFRSVDLRQQEPRPAAVARVCGEEFEEGGVVRRRQMPALADPLRETMMFSRFGARGDGSAGDQGQASCHTTHNAFVLLLFLSRDSPARVNGATQRGSGLL